MAWVSKARVAESWNLPLLARLLQGGDVCLVLLVLRALSASHSHVLDAHSVPGVSSFGPLIALTVERLGKEAFVGAQVYVSW